MKALSLWQPWASLVVGGVKRWETRSWKLSGPIPLQIAIHASANFPREIAGVGLGEPFRTELGRLALDPHSLPTGAILGVVTVAACLPTPEVRDLLPPEQLALGDFGPGRWAWRLTGAIALERPIRAKGALGLWDLGWDVEKAVLLQLEKAVE